MNLLQNLEHWGDTHHPKWMDIVRIALGVFLCYKGVDFLYNMSAMMSLMENHVPFSSFLLILLGHYVVFAHIVGGFLMAMGILTRFSSLIQIPILLGAVMFINASDAMRPYSELFLSLIVLVLLVYFLIAGNGPWAVNLYAHQKEK